MNIDFITNIYFEKNTHLSTRNEISLGLAKAKEIIKLYHQDPESDKFKSMTTLIGEGNNAEGKVYSIIGTKFCLKISKLSKYVGKKQEKQFEIAEQTLSAIKNKSVPIEGIEYRLDCIPAVAVSVSETHAYTFMIRIDNAFRLWDEQNTPYADKDQWEVIRAVKKIIREFGGEPFIDAVDVNGNNLLVNFQSRVMYLIDPYVP